MPGPGAVLDWGAMATAPDITPLPRPRGAGSSPAEWLDALLWQAGEILGIARASPWFPVLVMVLSALALLWLTGRLRRQREGAGQEADTGFPVTRKGEAGATCIWFRDRIRRKGTLERWQCRTCGVDAYTTDGTAPKECKRGLREAQL